MQKRASGPPKTIREKKVTKSVYMYIRYEDEGLGCCRIWFGNNCEKMVWAPTPIPMCRKLRTADE
jgi:hypothetical protein